MTKILENSDFGFYRPLIVSRSPFHADHFGINGIEIQELVKTHSIGYLGYDPDMILLENGTQILNPISNPTGTVSISNPTGTVLCSLVKCGQHIILCQAVHSFRILCSER